MRQYYIGIDFSLNSPCVAIRDTKNKDCITISFCRKKRPQFEHRRIVGADRGYYSFESSVLVTPEPESDTRKFYYTANAIVNGIRRTGCTEGGSSDRGVQLWFRQSGVPHCRGYGYIETTAV